MVKIRFTEEDEDSTMGAESVEIKDEWVVAEVKGSDGYYEQFIPKDRIHSISQESGSESIEFAE